MLFDRKPVQICHKMRRFDVFSDAGLTVFYFDRTNLFFPDNDLYGIARQVSVFEFDAR